MRNRLAAQGSRKWLVLATTSIATLLGTSDYSIVNIAFPRLTGVFSAETSTVVWVALAYQLAFVGLVLPMGRLGDQFGRRRVFIVGLLIYSIGMLLAASAQDVGQLIASRALQGGASAATAALSAALVTSAFPSHERGKALGVLAAIAALGLMAGPALGGVLLDTLGWRSIFYVRAPLGFLGVVAAWVFLEKDAIVAGDRRLDLSGSAALFLAMCALTLGVNRAAQQGWASPQILGLLTAGSLLLLVFFWLEVKGSSPVIDLRIFRSGTFAIGGGLLLLNTSLMAALSFLLPFYLIGAKLFSASTSGLILLASPAVMLLVAPLSGRLSDRNGPNLLTSLGLLLSSSGFFLASLLAIDSPVTLIVAFLILIAIGGALFGTPNQSALLGAAAPERLGTVSAVIPALRYVGLVIGLAAVEAIFAAIVTGAGQTSSVLTGDPVQRQVIVRGMAVALRAFGAVGVLMLALAIVRARLRREG